MTQADVTRRLDIAHKYVAMFPFVGRDHDAYVASTLDRDNHPTIATLDAVMNVRKATSAIVRAWAGE